jgi:hypothetical protein
MPSLTWGSNMIQAKHSLLKRFSVEENLVILFLFIAFVSLLVPVVSVKMPPILDYPNHYVRMWLLSGGIKIFPISEMYEITWKNASTNIGIDAFASLIASFLPIKVVAPFLLVAALVLPPLGVVCLNRTVFGAFHWWQVACVLLAWNWTLLIGLLNFEIGVGLALMCASIDRVLVRRGILCVAVGRMCIGAFIFLIHPFGLLFYTILVAALRLGPCFTAFATPFVAFHNTIAAVIACLPITIPLVLWLLFAPVLPGSQLNSGHEIIWQPLSLKEHLSVLSSPFKTYDRRIDAVFLFLLFVPLALAAAIRRIRVHAGLFLTAIMLLIFSNFMPLVVADTSSMELRLPAMAVLTLAASLLPEIPPSKQWQWAALSIALLLVAIRTGWIANIWVNRQVDIISLEKALAFVPSGAAILPMQHSFWGDTRGAPLGRFLGPRMPAFTHYPTLAVLERHAFVPTLFTAAGKQPLSVKAPWNQIAVPEGLLPSVDQINDPHAVAQFPYLAHWYDRFDFVLVVNADMPNHGGVMPMLPQIRLVADEGFAQLYKIRRTATGK